MVQVTVLFIDKFFTVFVPAKKKFFAVFGRVETG
jgi:hypothetical protein